jgi:hypothetical protein
MMKQNLLVESSGLAMWDVALPLIKASLTRWQVEFSKLTTGKTSERKNQIETVE